jgi:hypothetical protein
MTSENCNLPICWAELRWARSRGSTEGANAGRRTVGTHFYSNEYNWRSNAVHTESSWFLNNAYRSVSVHTATNIQSTVTAKNTIALLLKEVISIRFHQNLPLGDNWTEEDTIRQNTRVEEGSNTSTVTLRVVGADEKGSLKSETVKYSHKSQGTRTRERLHRLGPAAYTKDRPAFSSDSAPQKNKTVTVKQ